jgi:uncharacterized protein (DUF2236 family)
MITRAQLEALHVAIRHETTDPRAGVFGPGSATWRLGREAVSFLGAGRAILLQLAHPFVAHAVADHSQLKTDPIGRFRRTFDGVFGMMFGDLDTAFSLSRRVHAVHAGVHGELPDGERYHANDADAVFWVHATLLDTAVRVQERVFGRFPAERKAAVYAESKRFVALFGVPASSIPPDWPAFEAYVETMLASPRLHVDAVARELASYLFAGRSARLLTAVTAELLPPRLRDDFGFASGRGERALAAATFAAARHAVPLLPPRLRFAPAYQHARRRLAGKPGPDPVAAWLERLAERLAVA